MRWNWNLNWKHYVVLVAASLWAIACSGGFNGDDSGGGAWVGSQGNDNKGDLGDDDDAADDDDTADDLEDEEEGPCDDLPPGPVTLFMSADDSNSQAAPALARQLINEGSQIYSGMRSWEFLNYYEFGYEPAAPGHVSLEPQVRLEGDGSYTVTVAVVAPTASAFERRPRSLVYSVDVSGSMSGHSIDTAKQAMRASASNLEPGDIVSIVTWDTETQVLLENHIITGPNDAQLLAAINQMDTGGMTDLHSGLVAAYDMADAAYSPDRMNRVILVSDGNANVGTTDEQLIASHAEDAESEGIYLSGVGICPYAYSFEDVLMNQVTDAGKGAYIFLDSEDEADVIFGDDERFLSAMEIAAREVKLIVELPEGYLMSEFFGEEAVANPAELKSQHLAPGDAMIFHQTLVDCDASHDGSEEFTFTATWVDPLTREDRSDTLTLSMADMLAAPHDQLAKADALLDYAHALVGVWDVPSIGRYDYMQVAIGDALYAHDITGDEDLYEAAQLMAVYRQQFGEDAGPIKALNAELEAWWEEHSDEEERERTRDTGDMPRRDDR